MSLCFTSMKALFVVLVTGFFAVYNNNSNNGSPLFAHGLSMSTPTTTCKQLDLTVGSSTLRQLVVDAAQYDTDQTLDVNGIMWLEHVNLIVGSKPLTEYFYMDFLGLTKDASSSFHVNLGQQQFHLKETGDPPQKVAGSIGLVVPSLETLRERIPAAVEMLSETTQFEIIKDDATFITLMGPWGNIFHIYSTRDGNKEGGLESPHKMVQFHGKGGPYGPQRMAVRGNPGIRYLEIACPVGKTSAIANFYREMLGCTVMETKYTMDAATPDDTPPKDAAVVCVGPGVHLAFVEQESATDDATIQAMEGVHVCFYANHFQELYNKLKFKDLIWTNPRFVHLDTCDTWEEAFASRTLRFKDVIDLSSGEKILELEHETRPLRHGQYLKVPKYEPK